MLAQHLSNVYKYITIFLQEKDQFFQASAKNFFCKHKNFFSLGRMSVKQAQKSFSFKKNVFLRNFFFERKKWFVRISLFELEISSFKRAQKNQIFLVNIRNFFFGWKKFCCWEFLCLSGPGHNSLDYCFVQLLLEAFPISALKKWLICRKPTFHFTVILFNIFS